MCDYLMKARIEMSVNNLKEKDFIISFSRQVIKDSSHLHPKFLSS